MTIEIKKSQNPVKYEDAISFMEDRLKDIDLKKVDDLIWVLEHDHIYTCLLYTSPSPRDTAISRMPSSA